MVATHWTRRLGAALAATFAAALLSAGSAAADLPQPVDTDTFQDVPLATGLPAPTAVRFVPTALGNRMFVALKSGVVLAYDQPNDPNPIQVLDLSTEVHDFWDRGLLGMTLAPGFNESGGDMYLVYARDAAIGGVPPRWGDTCPSPPGADENGCVISGKLVRVHIGPLVAPDAPVQTLIQNQWCQQFPSHSVGTVAFGPDGKLYVSGGEGANFNAPDWGQFGYPSVNPCQDPYSAAHPEQSEGGALRAQDVESDGDSAGLSGSVIRIDPDTGAAAAGNPFSASADPNERKIIAYGLRNPFRFTFRPGTNDIWLGDVGWVDIDEIDKIDTDDNVVENFGWPCKEGTWDNVGYQHQDSCASLNNETPPEFQYLHGDEVVTDDQCSWAAGSSISGLAFRQSTGNYPSHFDGGLFFTDYARNCIWFAPADAGGEPDFGKIEVFARGPAGVGPVDLQIAPNGNLIYVFHDQTFGEIHEIRPVDQPTARIRVTDNGSGDFTFDASDSTPSTATYEWDWNGDNNWDATGSPVHHVFGGRQAPTVRLRVTSNGLQDTTSTRVSVGNVVPHDATITKTSVPAAWSVGDHLRFSGSAIDADDQNQLTYTWVMTVLHCPNGACHKHPVQTITGPTADFIAPSHEYPSRLQVTLNATDTLGFSSPLTTIELQPRVVTFTARAMPAPFAIRLNGVPGNSVAKTLIAGTAATLSTTTPQVLNGQRYDFAGWSDGDRSLSRTVAPRNTSTLTARFLRRVASTSLPTIGGSARTRHTLTGTPGGWTGDEVTFAYQWLRCSPGCTPIAGATTATYRVRDADLDKRLAVRVTARNDLGSAAQQSAESAKILEGVPPTVRLAGAKRVRLGDGRLELKVGCPSERCRLSVRGVLLVKGHKAGATRAVKKTLGRGEKATLIVRLSGRLRRAALNALKARRRVAVRFDVTVTDALSNRATSHRTVRVRR
jgi:glucose/arabinose dehydrogenase